MATFHPYKHLFTPLKVGHTELKNRVEFSPLVSKLVSPSGDVLPEFADFVEEQALSGVALIHIGATPVDHDAAVDYPQELDVTDENKIAGLVLLAEAAHRHGAKLSVELVHAGRGASQVLNKNPLALAPSNFPIEGKNPYIKEMDQHDIEQVIGAYTDCAARLKRCGFDGVLIHGAHGNLFAQFLSPLANHRTDIYGGSFENRCRFPLMLLKAVRETVGRDFIVELRISGDEIVPGGMRIEEVVEFLKKAQTYIDLVNVSAGIIVATEGQYYSMPPYFRPKGANVPFARAVKECKDIHIPVSVVGGIMSAEMADRIIDEGSSDMVAMARGLLCDPDLLNKSYRGKPETVRPCLRCWGCSGAYGIRLRCAVNPSLARPFRYAKPWPARVSKKVVVVGGGVAGTQAARTLTEKGHKVVLFEKNDKLGGLLDDINKLPFKDDMLSFTEWLRRETTACGADIRLNTEADAETVMAENPDVILVATGGVPLRPPIPGIDGENVFNVLDTDSGRKKPKGKIVVCGGGLSGCESALALAMEGNEVTITDMIPEADFATGTHPLTRNVLLHLLEEHNVKMLGGRLVRSIGKNGVETEDKNWKIETLEADFVVEAFGMKPNIEMKNRFFELIPDVYYIGDCSEIKNIMHASYSAYDRSCCI
ncbi:MAG: FAD-dependent oxidoreductase [Oscillospiraceae bacterium]|nr:FAD-dependent oxidoreductase [Oscillospiraceae bacterium]